MRDLSRRVSLVHDLLDDQVVDLDDLPLGRVDDVELALDPDSGCLRVTGLVVSLSALGIRLGGIPGAAMVGVAEHLRPGGEPPGGPVLDTSLVRSVRPMVRLRARLADLPGVAGLEKWLSQRVVSRLPGAGDALR